jgi:hypothetical protein
MRRRPTAPQIELPVTLVALAAAAAALVEALISLLVKTPSVHPHWARPAAAGILAFAALLSLVVARLRAGQSTTDRVRALRWLTVLAAVAAGAVALAAGLATG